MRLFLSGLIAGLAVLTMSAPAVAQAPPVEAYGALPAIEQVDLSPDGTSLVYIRHEGDQSQVVAQSRTGELLAMIDTSDRRVRSVSWVSPDHVVIASATTEKVPFYAAREELQVLDIVNVRTQRVVRALMSADRPAFNAIFDWRAGVYGGKPMIYVEAITRNPGLYSFDLYRVDLDTGRGRLQASGASDTRGYVVGRDGEVAARLAHNSEIGRWRLSVPSGGGWRDVRALQTLLDAPHVLGFGRTLDTLAVSEQRDGKWRLVEISTTDSDDRAGTDIGPSPNRALTAPSGALVGVGYMDVYQDYEFFRPELQASWDLIKASFPERQLTLSSFSNDFERIVFYVEGTGEPGAYYLYDGPAKRVSLIGRVFPELTGTDIAEVRIIRYRAADGLDLMGYLTLPPNRDPKDLPLIVLPHGGPASRDAAGFDWWPQAMASQGYAVFQPQFRGSNGFGVALLEAGYGEWGRKMQTDLSDGVDHLAGLGLIDPSRTCIVGASYGGYAALAGMTLQPGVYRCAVSVAGVSDLREMLAEEERRGARGEANASVRYWSRFMGGQGVNDRSLDAYSPAQLADRVTGPVLLIHGRLDTVVPLAQSTLMANALAHRGRLIVLEGEDHFLSTAATRQRMLTETIAFLEQHNPPD